MARMRIRKFRSIEIGLGVCVAAGLWLAAGAADPSAPPATSEGNWHGTWQYGNVQEKVALFMRQSEGAPVEIRLQYSGSRPVQEFATDWNGAASYSVQGRPASFELEVSERTDERISGTIRWDFPLAENVRESRSGKFVIYRKLDGRYLQLHADEFEWKRYSGETVIGRQVGPMDWSFRKRSKRIVMWEELP